jgi:GNAT superfamily N-acetyltransferase
MVNESCAALGIGAERRCSLLAEVRLAEATAEDWRALAALHYRSHRIGGLQRLWALRWRDELVAIIAYSLPAVNLAARNRALGELVARLPAGGRARFWNAHLRTISRVVVDPNWRGLGLSERLIRETLPLAGVPYVEALAAMGRVNPFFERAGLTRYEAAPPRASERLRAALATAGLDRGAARSAGALQAAVAGLGDERLRAWLTGEMGRWARSYLGAKTAKVRRPTLGRTCGYIARFLYANPAYFLWANAEMVGGAGECCVTDDSGGATL